MYWSTCAFADYPKFLDEAKHALAEELGDDHIWSDISFRKATEGDKDSIKLALDSEAGTADWAEKLGVNLFYSGNPVIYDVFGLNSSTEKK